MNEIIQEEQFEDLMDPTGEHLTIGFILNFKHEVYKDQLSLISIALISVPLIYQIMFCVSFVAGFFKSSS